MSRHHHMQWDNVIAKPAVAWEDGLENQAVLLVPRFRNGLLAKWLQPRLKRPHIRVKLDRIGSFVWRSLDGSKNFNQVLGEMRTEFGETIEPAEARLIKFFSILHKDKFVELFAPDENDS